MRKRAQRKSKTEFDKPKKPKHITQKESKKVEKRFNFSKNGWVAIAILSVFLLVLFFNTFFNFTSNVAYNPEGEGLEKYYLSGPDPYYNMRLVEQTHQTGEYPYYSENDPLLNYPIGRSGRRAPLFNMVAIGFSNVLTPFMSEVDALGLSMQFIPALFGALLVFPIYFIGKNLFGKKAGLIAAFFLAIIPVHIGSGHGSAFSLFDHDSFNLLLMFLTFMFVVFSIREKNFKKSLLYAVLGGIPLAALSMTWVQAQFLYVVIAIYAVVQMLFDIFLNKIELKFISSMSVLLFTGYFVSLPVIASRSSGTIIPLNTPLILCIAITAFGLLYYFFGKKRIPWTLSLPSIFVLASIGLVFLYGLYHNIINISVLNPLRNVAKIIFGTVIYGNKVSMTIAEANTYQISNTVMSFGPAIYWVGWAGLLLLFYLYYKNKVRKEFLLIITIFVIDLWLTSTAGRFINDMVPLIALLSGAIIWFVLGKLDYKQMIRDIKSAGGGIHGIRKGAKLLHIFVILFIGFVIILPNVFLVMDAAVPNKIYQDEDGQYKNLKWEIFGEGHSSAFGLSVSKEVYWIDAFDWLDDQDKYDEDGNPVNPIDKPAFISWWDYGFYEVATGGHPTVADNFQDGIPPAANFHTSTGEKEAVTIWLTRLIEGEAKNNNGKLSEETKNIIGIYFNFSKEEIVSWFEDPTTTPSFNEPIQEEYHKYFGGGVDSDTLRVGAQYQENALYHDMVNITVKNENTSLTDEEITSFYHDIQESTGYSIRYYGVEGYDKQIFNIFAFLADKSLILVGAPEDEFLTVTFDATKLRSDGSRDTTVQPYKGEPFETYLKMPDSEKMYWRVTNQGQRYKDKFFDTMFFKTYYGIYKTDQQGNRQIWNDNLQYPCVGMKHFYGEFISDFSKPELQYQYNGKAAVVIAKYYEGAMINGTISFMNESQSDFNVVVVKNLSYPEKIGPEGNKVELGDTPIDHDQNLTDSNGTFSVLAGAGANLQIRRYPELSFPSVPFVIKNVSLDISESDAMRETSNWKQNLGDISIEPGVVKGVVRDSTDNDTLPGVIVTFREVIKIPVRQGESPEYNDQTISNTTDTNGEYNASELIPGYYEIYAKYDDYFIGADSLKIYQGEKSYNISKPEDGNIKGVLYYDSNGNGEYDSLEDEVLKNTKVELVHLKSSQSIPSQYVIPETIDEQITNDEGEYSFESLIPGTIQGTKLNTYQLKVSNDIYTAEENVYPEENKTLSFNLSADLATVNVTGSLDCIQTDEYVKNVEIEFNPDASVENNTAESSSATSDKEGKYQIDLKPGLYNVTVEEMHESTLVYSGERKLNVLKGEVSKTGININLTKHSVNLSGYTKLDAENVGNITIEFSRDLSKVNNLAVSTSAESDSTGYYTVEISPGYYNVTVDEVVEDVTYSYSGSIHVEENDEMTLTGENILLTKEEE